MTTLPNSASLPYKNKISKPYGKSGNKRPIVTAICTCGKEFEVVLSSLTRKNPTRSCGCIRKHSNVKHGMTKTKIYRIWSSMIDRCHNKRYKQYNLYGGRGIKVTARWHKFENFYKDMGDKPEERSLDRIDNDKGYSKENCRWSTLSEQARNKRNAIFYNGENSIDASVRLGFKTNVVRNRVQKGWSLEKAFTTPSLKMRK